MATNENQRNILTMQTIASNDQLSRSERPESSSSQADSSYQLLHCSSSFSCSNNYFHRWMYQKQNSYLYFLLSLQRSLLAKLALIWKWKMSIWLMFFETNSTIQTNVQDKKEEEDNDGGVDQDGSTNECGAFWW